ncbi:glycosyltransferase family protein [Novosphingobium rosa]|uniref:hypothetical protein n=1 Tax=Novosphingobium rosa TaxID=76978 RepID=UPI00082B2571|nr:hypothetical protein [Novosphingobium rosa]
MKTPSSTPTSLADRCFRLAFVAILLLAVALRVLAFSPFDTIAHDETLQYQERAYRMVFGYGLVPWESRHGIRNALLPDLIAGAMAVAKLVWHDPGIAVLAGRIVTGLVGLALVPAAYALGSVRSRGAGIVAMFIAATWFESVIFSVHVLTESVALPFACGGAAALLRARQSHRAGLLAGFLLTMTVLLRLQFAVFAGVLVVLSLRGDRALYRSLALGALPALAIGAVSDLAAGMAPFAWVGKNIAINLFQGKAAYFGQSGPLAYVQAVYLRLLPFSVPILLGAVCVERRYRPLLIAAIANIAVHSLIGHKEYRFIWLSMFIFVILAGLTSVEMVERFRARRQGSPLGRAVALALLCLVWAGLSWGSLIATGGAQALRDGGGIAKETVLAARDPGICALGVGAALRKGVSYAYVRRPLPFYLVPESIESGQQSFPAPLADAVNALVLTDKTRPPAGFRRLNCEQDGASKVCLYRRAGGCRAGEASAPYSYEAMLLHNDM